MLRVYLPVMLIVDLSLARVVQPSSLPLPTLYHLSMSELSLLCPDPTPKRRKGSGTHRVLLGLADLACLNSVAPIRVAPCGDYHAL